MFQELAKNSNETKTMFQCKTAVEFWSQFPQHYQQTQQTQQTSKKFQLNQTTIKNLKHDLQQSEVHLYFVPWPGVYNIPDNAYEKANIMLNKDTQFNDALFSLIYFTDHDLYTAEYSTGILKLNYKIHQKDRKITGELLNWYFGDDFVYSQTDIHPIQIKLKETDQ